MIILTLGLPGAGKGAVSRKLRAFHKFDILATGDLFRKEIAKGTDLGKQVQAAVNHGDFVPNELVESLFDKHIDLQKDLVFLGFPRNVEQAKFLDEYLEMNGKKIDLVLHFDVEVEELYTRAIGRRVCDHCGQVFNMTYFPPKEDNKCDNCQSELTWRSDDHKEALDVKVENYNRYTLPLVEYYQQTGLVTPINGNQSSQDVYYDVLASSKKFTMRNH